MASRLKFFIRGSLDGVHCTDTLPPLRLYRNADHTLESAPHMEHSILGIDLGARRIGIAVSDSGVLATPHSVMRNEGDVVTKLTNLANELEAELFVVGIPRRTHASANDQKYRDFADALRQTSCKQVVLWDESLSTVEAAERLRASGRNRREAQKEIDMHAAAVILQAYLDDQARGRSS
jgi:putative Holliday junction resolvase